MLSQMLLHSLKALKTLDIVKENGFVIMVVGSLNWLNNEYFMGYSNQRFYEIYWYFLQCLMIEFYQWIKCSTFVHSKSSNNKLTYLHVYTCKMICISRLSGLVINHNN